MTCLPQTGLRLKNKEFVGSGYNTDQE